MGFESPLQVDSEAQKKRAEVRSTDMDMREGVEEEAQSAAQKKREAVQSIAANIEAINQRAAQIRADILKGVDAATMKIYNKLLVELESTKVAKVAEFDALSGNASPDTVIH